MLFKFATTKPDAVALWNTISNTSMPRQGGWTDYQLRFLIFCAFQLNEFTVAKETVNRYLEQKTHGTFNNLEALVIPSINTRLINTLIQPPVILPVITYRELYLPFYYCMQLGLDVAMIEHLCEVKLNTEEVKYITLGSQNDPLDPYKLSLYKLSVHSDLPIEHYSDLFKIDESLPPVVIKSKNDLIDHLKSKIYNELLNRWDEYSKLVFTFEELKQTIPPFQLKESK